MRTIYHVIEIFHQTGDVRTETENVRIVRAQFSKIRVFLRNRDLAQQLRMLWILL